MHSILIGSFVIQINSMTFTHSPDVGEVLAVVYML